MGLLESVVLFPMALLPFQVDLARLLELVQAVAVLLAPIQCQVSFLLLLLLLILLVLGHLTLRPMELFIALTMLEHV